jgi:hypothetical protein
MIVDFGISRNCRDRCTPKWLDFNVDFDVDGLDIRQSGFKNASVISIGRLAMA